MLRMLVVAILVTGAVTLLTPPAMRHVQAAAPINMGGAAKPTFIPGAWHIEVTYKGQTDGPLVYAINNTPYEFATEAHCKSATETQEFQAALAGLRLVLVLGEDGEAIAASMKVACVQYLDGNPA